LTGPKVCIKSKKIIIIEIKGSFWDQDLHKTRTYLIVKCIKQFDKLYCTCDGTMRNYDINFDWWTSKLINNVDFAKGVWQVVLEMLLHYIKSSVFHMQLVKKLALRCFHGMVYTKKSHHVIVFITTHFWSDFLNIWKRFCGRNVEIKENHIIKFHYVMTLVHI
jgi:hypothetical protein